jgi:hypothetical protein
MSVSATTSKIMVIRHAEKPTGDDLGITITGSTDKESLIVQGWQRAGALTVLFAPFNTLLQNKLLATPTLLYAAATNSESKSKRPIETITPVSQWLNIPINETFGKSDPKKMADDAMQQNGIVLICWQHQDIPHIANHILGNKTTAPQTWPGDRFDLVWVFDLNASTGQYTFVQVPQNVLAGDLNTIIS